jgi:Mg-chelatase subunit ChlD
VGLLTFSTGIDLVAPIADVATTGETTRSRVLGLVAEGDTNLNGAVCRATRMIAEEQARDAAAGDNRLYGIVLLSDGMDTVGEISSTRMFQTCLTAREGREGPKLFVISFGEGTDMETLTRLANESNGALFTADPASIGQAYLRISAEQ